MNFCQRCRAQLGEFLDGTLSPSAQENVAAHLQTCADCAQEKRAVEATRAALNDLKPVAAPPELRLRVRAALQNEAVERAQQKPGWGVGFSFLRPQKFAWAGTLALSAVTLLVLARPFATRPLTFHDGASAISDEPAFKSPAPKGPTPQSSTPQSLAPKSSASALKLKVQNHVVASKSPPSAPKIVAKPAVGSAAKPPSASATQDSKPSPNPVLSTPAAKTDEKKFQPPAFHSGQKTPAEAVRGLRADDAPLPSSQRSVARPNLFAAPKSVPSPVPAPSPADSDARDSISVTNGAVLSAGAGGMARLKIAKAPGFSVEISSITEQRKMRTFSKAIPAPVAPPITDGAAPGAISKMQGGFGGNANTLSATTRAAAAPAAAQAAAPGQAAAPASATPPQTFRFRGGDTQPPAPETPAAPTGDEGGGRGAVNGVLHDENSARINALESRPVPPMGLKPSFDILTPSVPKTYSLRIHSSQAVKNAQIRVELPPALHFTEPNSGVSRVLWTGDFEADKVVQVNLSVLGSSPSENIQIFLEQNQPGAQSKLLEMQTLPLP